MKKRRGLSTVVGAVFAIIAITTTIAYVTYSMNTLSQYNQSVMQQNQKMLDTGKEKFQITSVTVPNGKFNITVANTGILPINFTKLWVQNTSATDWDRSYVPKNGFVAPGGILKNIGQDTSNPTIKSANSYNAMLVTSRGTMQQFTVNSASASPLNIQLMFLPSTVASGFNTELVMIVTNNSTGTLTNISPSALPSPTYTGSGTTSCVSSSVSPASYNTLAPGSTAIFKWDITVSGYGSDTCTYTINQPLQNGYTQTLTATATVTTVNLSSSSFSQNSGVVTISYTTFHWTQGSKWNIGWSFPSLTVTDFYATLTNNNSTGGGYKLWLSQNTQLFLFQTNAPANGKINSFPFFIVGSMPANPPTPPTLTAYSDYSIGLPNQGGTSIIYFGATSAGSTTQSSTISPIASGTYFGFLLIYGKFTQNSGDTPNGLYAQSIPIVAVIAT